MPTTTTSEARSKSRRRPKGEDEQRASSKRERSPSSSKRSSKTSSSPTKVSLRSKEKAATRTRGKPESVVSSSPEKKVKAASRNTREDTYITLRDGTKKRVKADAENESSPSSSKSVSGRKDREKSKSVRKEMKMLEDEDDISKRNKKKRETMIREKTVDLDKPTMSAISRRSAIPIPVVASAEASTSKSDRLRQTEDFQEPPSHVESRPPRLENDDEDPSNPDQSVMKEEEKVEVDYDYDDDFEEYDDDDFEEESEEEPPENKMDSGNYESARLLREMEEVKAAMQRENSAANYPRSSDGDQHHHQHDSGHGSNDEREVKRKPSGKITVNFASAKQRQKSKLISGKTRKRGEALLTMIRLDVAKYDLFELPPIAYEALMAGQSNRVQASCQTGEDDLDEELQTDLIEVREKWTQHPPPPLTSVADLEDMSAVMQALQGVGGEVAEKRPFNHEDMKSINAARLSKFLESASQALITLLEEDAERKLGSGREAREQKDVVFSEKVTLLDTDSLGCLSERPVTCMSFASDQPCLLLTAHGPLDDFRSYLTIWNVSSPLQPLHILVTSGDVRSVCFSPSKASMAFAGMMDGSISVWDLREPHAMHQEVKKDDGKEKIHRSPTFTTSSGEENGHDSAITGLKPLPDEVSLEGSYGDTFQIVSCEVLGRVIIWTVLDALRDSDVHLGLAHWGCVRIVNSVQMDLDGLSTHDVIFGPPRLNAESRGDLFVALGNGHIQHGSIHADHKPSPRLYKAELDSNIAVRSLTFCPFGEQFILAGCDDGSVRLHSVTSEKPLITWPGTVDGQPILQIIWSPSRPCVFFVLDTDSRVHLWDLGVGDIYPAHSVQFEERVTAIGLNPELADPRLKQMLALGMHNGRVEVHHLKADYRASDVKSCTKELDRFLHYVSII